MMKAYCIIVLLFLVQSVCFAQNSNTLTGDWVRVNATQSDGKELPYNHPGRIFQRYYFVKNKVLVVIANTTTPMEYTLTGNNLKLGPVQTFNIEKRTSQEMVFQESKSIPVRYFFIPTDSFTINNIIKPQVTVSATDTVYTSTVGIEPIYPEGSMAFMKYIMQSFGSVEVSLEFTFVVRKDGTVDGVEVEFTTNEKMNKRLTQILKKTSGKWIPGSIGGKPVDVRTQGNITLSRR